MEVACPLLEVGYPFPHWVSIVQAGGAEVGRGGGVRSGLSALQREQVVRTCSGAGCGE